MQGFRVNHVLCFPQGALDEAKLIDWPSLGSASVQTGVVVLIIFGSTALLIAVNTALAQVSQLLF